MLLLHQLKYIFRNILTQKTHSIINILGLSVAMASIIIMVLWVTNELSYDKSFSKSDRIFRLTVEVNAPDGYKAHFARLSQNIPIETKIPEIISKVRFAPLRNTALNINEHKFYSNKAYQTDTSVFEVFNLKLLIGDPNTALSHPKTLIISESMAKKYFASANCIGQVINLFPEKAEKSANYTITGVYEDFPQNSHFHFDLLTSFDDAAKFNGWAYNYLLLNANTSFNELQAKIDTYKDEFYTEEFSTYFDFHLQAISDIHLHSKKGREIEQNGNYQSVILLITAAIFIFFIALINFINLNIALLFKELKYLISNKIFGAKSVDILKLQLLKTAIVCIISSVISLVFVYIIKEAIDSVFWMNSIFLENQFNNIILILLVLIALLILMGGLPVFLFINGKLNGNSLFSQNKSLVSLFNPNKKFLFRKVLLITQFTVSIVLIISSIFIQLQMNLMISNQMKSNDSKIMVMKNLPNPVRADYSYFKQELLAKPFVKGVSASMEAPPSQIMDGSRYEISGQSEEDKEKTIYINPVDDNYFTFYNQQILAGEDFPNYVEGKGFDNYIVNEKAAKMLGYQNSDEIIGKTFKLVHSMIDFKEGAIIGVVKDFHNSSLHHEIKPLVYFQRPQFYLSFFIKMDTANFSNNLRSVESVWNKVYPNYPFEYHFSEQLYEQAYINEYTQTKLSSGFSIIAMLISFTGLFGLVSILANQRKKEIGIRKVLGASTVQIIYKLSVEFFQLICIASVIAITTSYFLINEWLLNFAYRINLLDKFWIFLLIFVVLIVFVMLMVSLKSLVSARINPVDNLRYE